jgi:metal-responsive CopG/Arc/MetJ family transcriptional regulator
MTSVAKVAISIPAGTLKSLERVRARLRKTRSAVVTEAIERWLAAEELDEDDKRYVQGYLRQPEPAVEVSATATAVVAGWKAWK